MAQIASNDTVLHSGETKALTHAGNDGAAIASGDKILGHGTSTYLFHSDVVLGDNIISNSDKLISFNPTTGYDDYIVTLKGFGPVHAQMTGRSYNSSYTHPAIHGSPEAGGMAATIVAGNFGEDAHPFYLLYKYIAGSPAVVSEAHSQLIGVLSLFFSGEAFSLSTVPNIVMKKQPSTVLIPRAAISRSKSPIAKISLTAFFFATIASDTYVLPRLTKEEHLIAMTNKSTGFASSSTLNYPAERKLGESLSPSQSFASGTISADHILASMEGFSTSEFGNYAELWDSIFILPLIPSAVVSSCDTWCSLDGAYEHIGASVATSGVAWASLSVSYLEEIKNPSVELFDTCSTNF